MKYRLSDHARKRLQQRNIKEEWLLAAIDFPDAIENDDEDGTLIHALKDIPDRGFRRLRVIYNETTKPITIVTAYFE